MKKRLLAIIFAVGFTFALASCGGNTGNSSPNSTVCSHTYDNACDANCNVCGDERTPTAEHTHDNACDADCNACGNERTPAEHVYDNEYDGKCNVCGNERTVPEDPVNGGNWTGEVPLS